MVVRSANSSRMRRAVAGGGTLITETFSQGSYSLLWIKNGVITPDRQALSDPDLRSLRDHDLPK